MGEPVTLTGRIWKHRGDYLFIAPGYFVFLSFMLVPLLYAVGLSFYRASFNLSAKVFIGFGQYQRLFQDPVFLKALVNTILYTFIIVPMTLLVSLFIALAIDPLHNRLQAFFRAAFYMPTVAGGVVLSIVWLWILNPTYGLLNFVLGWFGIEPVSWLASAPESFWAVCLVVLTFTVGEPIILFLAGLAAIPRELIDSAVVEGAGNFQITLRIRLPLIKPVMLFILATQTIRVFQLWEVIFMLSQGGPYNSSTSLVFLIYQTAFIAARYGKASAIGVVLLLIIFVVTLMQIRLWKESDV